MTTRMLILTGLWKKEGPSGETYLNGNLNKLGIYIFDNPRASQPGQPDYLLKISDSKMSEKYASKDTDKNFNS